MDQKPVTHKFDVTVLGVEYTATFETTKAKANDIIKCARKAFKALDIARGKDKSVLQDVKFLTKISATGITYLEAGTEKTITYEDLEKLVQKEAAEAIEADVDIDISNVEYEYPTDIKPGVFSRIQYVYAFAWGHVIAHSGATEAKLETKIASKIGEYTKEVATLAAQLTKAAVIDKNLPLVRQIKVKLDSKKAELKKYIALSDAESHTKVALLKDNYLAKAQAKAYRDVFKKEFKEILQKEDDLVQDKSHTGKGKGRVLSEKYTITVLFDLMIEKETWEFSKQAKTFRVPLCDFSQAERQTIRESKTIKENCEKLAEDTLKQMSRKPGIADVDSTLFKASISEHPFIVTSKSVNSKEFETELAKGCKALKASKNPRDVAVINQFTKVQALQENVLTLSLTNPINDANLLKAIKEFNQQKKELINLLVAKEVEIAAQNYPVSPNIKKYEQAILLGLETHGRAYCDGKLAKGGINSEQQQFLLYQKNQFTLQVINQLLFYDDHKFIDFPNRLTVIKDIETQNNIQASKTGANGLISKLDELVVEAKKSTLSEDMREFLQDIKDTINSLISLMRDLFCGSLKPGSPEKKAKLKGIADVVGDFQKNHKKEVTRLVNLELSGNITDLQKASNLEEKSITDFIKQLGTKGIKGSPAELRTSAKIALYTEKMTVLLEMTVAMPIGGDRDRILCLHDQLAIRVHDLENSLVQASDLLAPSIQVMRLMGDSHELATNLGKKDIKQSFDQKIEEIQKKAQTAKEKSEAATKGSTKVDRNEIKKEIDSKTDDFVIGLQRATAKLEKQARSLSGFTQGKIPDTKTIESFCEKAIEDTYLAEAKKYLTAIGVDAALVNAQAKTLIERIASEKVASVLETLVKGAKNPTLSENLLSVRNHYTAISLTNPTAPSKGVSPAAKAVEEVIQSLQGQLETDAKAVLALDTTNQPVPAAQKLQEVILKLNQDLTAQLKNKRIRDPQFIANLTTMIWNDAYAKSVNGMTAAEKGAVNQALMTLVENGAKLLKGIASQLRPMLSDKSLEEIIENQPREIDQSSPKVDVIPGGPSITEQLRIQGREKIITTDASLRSAKFANDPLFQFQKEMILNTVNTSDLADFQLRNYPFASFEDFTKAVDASVQAKQPKEKTLVAETIKLVQERAEQFAKCEKLIQSTDITKPEQLEKLNKNKDLQTLKKLDEAEKKLHARWGALGGQEADYFIVMRDHAGMVVADTTKNAYVLDSYAPSGNTVYSSNNLQLVRKLYPHPTLAASPNAPQEAAKRNFANAVVRDGLIVPLDATSQANEISKGFPIVANQPKNLAEVLELGLEGTKRISISTPVGKSTAEVSFNLSIASQIANEAVTYKSQVERFVQGATSDLSSHLSNDIENQVKRVTYVGRAPNIREIATSVRITVLLQQLSIARALTTASPQEAARKAIVVYELLNRLSNDIATNPPSQLPAAAKSVIANNLDDIRRENSKTIFVATGNLSLDELGHTLSVSQLKYALGAKGQDNLTDLITKIDTNNNANVATVQARTMLEHLNIMIEFEGADPSEIEIAIAAQLSIINEWVNQSNFGVLASLVLISELRSNSDPRMQSLLQPLLDKLNNKVEGQLSDILKPEFAALKLTSFPSATKQASAPKPNDNAIKLQLAKDPGMQAVVAGTNEAHFGDLRFASQTGIFLSSATRKVGGLISDKAVKSLGDSLNDQLKPLFTARTPAGHELSRDVFRSLVYSSREEKQRIQSCVIDGKPLDPKAQYLVEQDLIRNLNTAAAKLSPQQESQVKAGVKVLVLLDRLSIAMNCKAISPDQEARKALIIQSITDELSKAVIPLEVTSMSVADQAQIQMNLNEIKQPSLANIPEGNTALGKLNNALLKGQVDQKEQVATKFKLDSLIFHLNGNAPYTLPMDVKNKLNEVNTLSKSTLTLTNSSQLTNDLKLITDEAKKPGSELLILGLIQAIKVKSNPALTSLLNELNLILKSRLFSAELMREFDTLKLGSLPDIQAKGSSKVHQLPVLDVLMAAPVGNRNQKAVQYEQDLKKYFELEKSFDPNSHKNYRDLIDLPLPEQLPEGERAKHLKWMYDEVFNEIKTKGRNEVGIVNLFNVRENNNINAIHVDKDPLPAIYYWIRKANACTTESDKNICYAEVTRLAGKLRQDQQVHFKAAPGSTKFFSEP